MASVEELLARARARFVPLTPVEAADRMRRGALLVDVRLPAERARDGVVPGALAIALNHLEWRLDPASPHAIAQVTDHDTEVILLCTEGYCSSLAAARLLDLGLHHAADVAGGFRAWRAAGLPVEHGGE